MAFEWIAGLKALPGLLRRINDLQLFEASLEHRERVVKLSEDNEALRRTVAERDAKVAELGTFLSLRSQLRFDRNAYWRNNEGPFCPRCFDAEKKAIHLVSGSAGPGWRYCPNCNQAFETGR